MLIIGGIALAFIAALFTALAVIVYKRKNLIFLSPAEYSVKMNALDNARTAAIDSAVTGEEIDIITDKYEKEISRYRKKGGNA